MLDKEQKRREDLKKQVQQLILKQGTCVSWSNFVCDYGTAMYRAVISVMLCIFKNLNSRWLHGELLKQDLHRLEMP